LKDIKVTAENIHLRFFWRHVLKLPLVAIFDQLTACKCSLKYSEVEKSAHSTLKTK
jgi:hypothetical protein